MAQPLHLIYIPGLGDTKEPRGQLWAVRRWAKYGVEAELLRMNWGDKESWEPKFERLLARIDDLQAQGKLIGLVGASAGATAIINAFEARQKAIVGIACIAGKINRPEAIRQSYRDENPAFVTSAFACQESLQSLDSAARHKILTLYGLFDEVVVTKDSRVPGAHNRVSPSIFHGLTIAYQITLGAPGIIRFLKKQARE